MTSRPRLVFLALAAAVAVCFVCLRSAETQSSLRRITNTTDEGINVNPSISGDGQIIGFESTEDVAGAGGPNYFRAIRANISVDPPTFFQMGRTRTVAPGISQDGSRIVFASKDDPLGTNADGNSEIFVFNGANLLQITNTTPGSPGNRVIEGNFQPSISDDGRFVAFSSNRNLTSQNGDGNLEVFVFDSAVTAFTQLTNSTGIVGFSDAKISGDGSAIACIRDTGATASTNRDLFRINRTNAAQTVLALNVARLAMTYGRAISDDGERVAYSAETAANSTQVFFYDGRTGNVNRQVTTLGTRTTEVPLHPTISGDGRRIAFAARRAVTGFSNSDSSVELYTYDIPTNTFARITNATNSDADCFEGSNLACEVVSSLSDDGSTVVFNFPRALSGTVTAGLENKSEIYATGLAARPPFGALTSILNQASLGREPSPVKAVAPNSIAAAFGSVLANITQQPERQADGTFPTNVGGTTVTVNGRAAQIFFVSPTRVHFLVPPQTEIGNAEVVITNADGFASRGTVPVLLAAPGIFTKTGDGLGEGMILNADTLEEGPFDPSGGNLRLLIFSTGVRRGVTRTVSIGGRVVIPDAVNESTEMPGLDEVIVGVPTDLRGTGNVTLFITTDGRDSNPVTVRFLGDASRNVVINEVLADPPDGIGGDANHDGVRDGTDDEFVELVNGTSSEVISLGGWTIRTRATGSTTENTRFTFPSGTSLPAGEAIVVFGGGTFNSSDRVFGCAQVVKATTTAGLSLTNSGVTILIRNASGTLITEFSYGGSTGLEGDNNQSLTRSPDITGAYVQHTAAGGPGTAYSPGTRTNGTPFGFCPTALARIEVTPSPATIEVGGQQQFTARGFDSNNNEITGLTFTWQSSNTSVATINQSGLATGVSTGQTNITASAPGVTSTPAVLNVTPATPVLTSVTISPASATIGAGETQQFVGQAKDQFGNDLGGVTVTFTSSSAVATVDSTTATSSTGAATATVTGQFSGSAQITAHATNGSTTVNSTAATLTVEPGAGQLLISEFRTRGPLGAGDEFVEIYNPTTSTQIIGGLKIRASNSSGTVSDRVTITSGTTLGPGCHYLVANTGASPDVASPNQTYGTGIADDGGIAITGSNGTRIIDAVGMSNGSAYKEGTPLAPLTGNENKSYERKPGLSAGNGFDTNNNANDFKLQPSTPENPSSPCRDTSSASLSISVGDNPDPVTTGTNLTYTLVVSNNGAANAQNVIVTDDLPAGVTFVSCSATGGGVCGGSGNNRTVTYASLLAGAFETVTLVVNVTAAPGATITNTATISSPTPDSNLADNTGSASTFVQAPLPTLSISDVSGTEGNAGTSTFTFTVTLSSPAPMGGVTFDIATQDSSATSGSGDYVVRSLTSQSIPAGQTTYTFDVTVNGDTTVEPNETFFVNLSNVSANAAIADGQGVGTIQNDDTADLVISQTYPGGGLSGATFTHDFIELFNQGTTTVNFAVTPYSVQFLSTSGSTWTKTDLTSGSIAPGGYFLIQETSGGANGAPLPMTNATGSLNLTSTTPGKVALVVGTTLLTLSCPGDDGSAPFNPVDPTVVDFVGYGGTSTTANHCYEGSGPAPFTSGNNTIADFRKFGGCQDTNDNVADFLTATPNPRNTGSPINNCNAADLEITKTDSPDPVVVGSNVTYTITVTNHGPATANSVVVTDNLPANVTFVSCGSTGIGVCGGSGNNRTVTYTSIAPGGSETITLIASANGPAGTPISNTATVSSSTTDLIGANNSATTTTGVINPNSADLSISKSDSIDPVAPGNTLTYTITLTNNGPDSAQSVVVTDALPADVTFVDCSADQGGGCGGPPTAPTVSFASLASGTTATITIRVTVSNALTTGAVLSNTASVTASSLDPVSGNDSDTETTNVQTVNAGDILISEFRFRGSSGANDEFIELYNPTTRTIDISGFKIFRSNNAGGTSAHATINAGVFLPPGCHYLLTNANSSGPYNDLVPGDQTYSTGTADDGGLAVTLASGTASSGILDQVGLSAGSAYQEGTPLASLGTTNDDRSYERKPGGAFGNGTDTNNNSADFLLNAAGSSNPQNSSSGCLNTSSADLSITKSDSPDPVTIGSDITYTVTVLNNGAATAQNVLVTDNLPAEVAFVSCNASGGAVCGGSGNNRTVTLSSLASGASFTITLVATANGPDGTTASNTASVSSTTTDANSSNDSATATTLMQNPLPSLSIDDVTLSEGTGGTTNFVFTVTLTPASSQTVTVNYATSSLSPATAAAGTDYVSTSGMLTFTPSDTSEQITVQVNGDTANEAICETFFVNLSSPVNATISDGTGQGGITDDDGTKVVISQVYGGGGNGGATYTHDFIEIFNRGNTTVSLTGWSVQYAAAAGTTWSVTPLSGSIAPGKYYLIQENSGGAVGVPLPTPDATGTITMAAGAGKVALVNSTTPLTGACPSSSAFIDLIGYGTTANCFEGSGTAPTPSASLSDQRAANGCTDVGNNATDFATATPLARNSVTPANTCSCSTSYSSFFSFGDDWLKASVAKLTVRRAELPLVRSLRHTKQLKHRQNQDDRALTADSCLSSSATT